MKRILNGIVVISLIFLAVSNAGALMIGDHVRMDVTDGASHPYLLTDIDNNIEYTSFCLERWQYFTDNGLYHVHSYGEYAIGGGNGDLEFTQYGVKGDPIEEETRWLYAAFMSGVFNGITDTYGRNAATLVQYAIWYQEKEIVDGSAWNTLKPYYENSTYGSIADGWNIVAVNIYSSNNPDNQSQLVGVAPVPEPATMLLLGTGLIGLAGIGRKKFLG